MNQEPVCWYFRILRSRITVAIPAYLVHVHFLDDCTMWAGIYKDKEVMLTWWRRDFFKISPGYLARGHTDSSCLKIYSRYNHLLTCHRDRVEPFTHLYISSRILNSILALTGNQCSDFKMGLIWSCFRARDTILAAKFCILWSCCNLESGKL